MAETTGKVVTTENLGTFKTAEVNQLLTGYVKTSDIETVTEAEMKALLA